MKKTIKKITKKEAASPKGKAVAGKGKEIAKDKTPAAIEFKLTDKVAKGGRPLYELVVKGKKTNCLFTGIREEYQEHNDEKVEAFKALKGINCMDIPENMTISLTLNEKLPVGDIAFVEFNRKGTKLNLSYSIFIIEEELIEVNLNPIKLFKNSLSMFLEEIRDNVKCNSDLNFETGEDSIVFVTVEYPRKAIGKLGSEIKVFLQAFYGLVNFNSERMMAELTPAKTKK